MTVITGPQRQPWNQSIEHKGSIHDDETATQIGFRGGTVAGDVHLDQFGPVLLEAFGEEWFRTGSLSLYFTYATTHREPVIAKVERPSGDPDAQVRAWMETPEGTIVCDGTASVGTPVAPSALYARDLRPVDPSTLRILRDVVPGEDLDPIELTPTAAKQRATIEQGIITEPMDWYVHTSPWGGAIASPTTLARLLHWDVAQPLSKRLPPVVGMFGAMEIRHLAGPVFIDRTYRVSGRVVAVSDSPKTEVLWYDTVATELDGTLVASLRMMSRFVKASSDLYR